MATAAYRQLLRSSRIAFQGDMPTLLAARSQISSTFRQNRSLVEPQASHEIQQAKEVAKILLENIVQGRQVNGVDDGMRYKLRIHEHTERGDNDTIKMPNGKKVIVDGKKCTDK